MLDNFRELLFNCRDLNSRQDLKTKFPLFLKSKGISNKEFKKQNLFDQYREEFGSSVISIKITLLEMKLYLKYLEFIKIN